MKILIFLFFIVPVQSYSQRSDLKNGKEIEEAVSKYSIRQNAILIEDFYALCYERIFPREERKVFALKAVIVIFDPFLFYIEGAFLAGGPTGFFEAGFGTCILYNGTLIPTIRAGYRYQSQNGFVFKASPMILTRGAFPLAPLISFGYAF